MREQPGQRSYLPGEEQTEAAHDQEIETVLDEFIGKVTQPTIQRGPVLAVEHFTESLSDEAGRQLMIACCQGVSHGFVHLAPGREPGGRPALQFGYTVRSQLGCGVLEQHAAEHLVIAVPLLVAVQGADKQVVPFDPLDTLARAPLGIFTRDHGFAQRDAEMIQDRSL